MKKINYVVDTRFNFKLRFNEVRDVKKHTEQEEKELNNQLKKWQEKQLNAARKVNFDYACEKMTEIDRSVWEIIARAKSYKDVNWIVWNQAEKIIDKYDRLAR